jgi:hypothetical protein
VTHRDDLRAWVELVKLVAGCRDCGYRAHPAALDFDHVRGDKVANVSVLVNRGFPAAAVRDEVAKCDVVCANCHRVRTATRHDERHAAAPPLNRRARPRVNPPRTPLRTAPPRVPMTEKVQSALRGLGEPSRLARIAAWIGAEHEPVSRQTMSGTLNRMAAEGVVERIELRRGGPVLWRLTAPVNLSDDLSARQPAGPVG